ncbi:hypothetical protein JHW43_000139 [Diplocarpon mali]|nr:hypothetical protein JHW43_000139 [Diplocarpon mali]
MWSVSRPALISSGLVPSRPNPFRRSASLLRDIVTVSIIVIGRRQSPARGLIAVPARQGVRLNPSEPIIRARSATAAGARATMLASALVSGCPVPVGGRVRGDTSPGGARDTGRGPRLVGPVWREQRPDGDAAGLFEQDRGIQLRLRLRLRRRRRRRARNQRGLFRQYRRIHLRPRERPETRLESPSHGITPSPPIRASRVGARGSDSPTSPLGPCHGNNTERFQSPPRKQKVALPVSMETACVSAEYTCSAMACEMSV